MIGTKYWANGIVVRHSHGRWSARVDYFDDGFANDAPEQGRISTEGTLHTRYLVQPVDGVDVLAVAIDVVKADVGRLGIEFKVSEFGPTVYYDGDGENDQWPPPDGWREMVDAQSVRLGWVPIYTTLASEETRP